MPFIIGRLNIITHQHSLKSPVVIDLLKRLD